MRLQRTRTPARLEIGSGSSSRITPEPIPPARRESLLSQVSYSSQFPARLFTLTHASAASHLQSSQIGDTHLRDNVFFADLSAAAETFFAEVRTSAELQKTMQARLLDIDNGGAIYY
jgi:hypothetical protein